MAGNKRYEVREVLADGTPVYETKALATVAHFRLNNGNYFRFGETANEVVTPQGELIWAYTAKTGMDGLNIYPWSPGVADLQFGISGHAVATTGDLGEFLVVHANNGQMNIWSADGLLAGHVTHHLGDPRARGWPAEHARGTRLDGLTLGQEHFHHYFCKTEQDNKYYIVGGGLETCVIEVKGIEKFTRISGEFTVTPEMLEKSRQWDGARIRRVRFAKPFVLDCAPGAPEEGAASAELKDLAKFQMGYDSANLHLKWVVRPDAMGPLKNTGEDFHRYFKTGAAVDVQLGADPAADPDRNQPVAGDIRVLVTVANNGPVAVLYRPVAPQAPKEQAWSISTPAGGTMKFDQVTLLKNAVVKVQPGQYEAIVTAAIPLADLGMKITGGSLLRMDWGVLSTRDGNTTSARKYWANAMAVGVSDEPTEARLYPNLWGFVRFTGAKDVLDGAGPGSNGGEEDAEDMLDNILGK